LTPGLIDSLLTNIFIACGHYPNLIVVSPNVARAYRALFVSTANTPIFNIQEPKFGNFDPFPSFVNVNSGFNQNLSYGGIKVIVDPNISETDGGGGKLYALNTDYLVIKSLPYSGPSFALSTNSKLVHGIDENQSTITEIPCTLKPLPIGGLGMAWTIVTQIQLVVTRPQAHGWMRYLEIIDYNYVPPPDPPPHR
jgi:hypothetical protein